MLMRNRVVDELLGELTNNQIKFQDYVDVWLVCISLGQRKYNQRRL